LDFLRRIRPYQGLTPTPRALFSFCAASRLKEAERGRRRCPFTWVPCVDSLVFISSSSGLFERGEGLVPFSERGRLGAVPPDPGGRGARWARKRETLASTENPRVMSPGTEAQGKNGRSIRRPARIRSQKSPIRFSGPMDKRTGASPSCLKSVSRTPAFETYPFGFAHARRMRPLSVGRVDNASHPAKDHYSMIQLLCKANDIDMVNLKMRRRPSAAARG
jgi:hypothetical protein